MKCQRLCRYHRLLIQVLSYSILPLFTVLALLCLRNMGEPRSRILSTPDYYSTISDISTLSPNEIQTFTSKAKNSTLECLLRESLSQLGERKKQLGGMLSETAQTIKSLEQTLATSETNGQIPNSNLLLLYAETMKKTLDERDYDSKA